MDLIQGKEKIFKRLLGYGLLAGSVLLFTATLYAALVFFYAQERILFLFPSLAQPVSIEELVGQYDRFDQKWISIQGELWRKTDESNYLDKIRTTGGSSTQRGQKTNAQGE